MRVLYYISHSDELPTATLSLTYEDILLIDNYLYILRSIYSDVQFLSEIFPLNLPDLDNLISFFDSLHETIISHHLMEANNEKN